MRILTWLIIVLCLNTFSLQGQSDSDKGTNYKDQVINDELIVQNSTCIGLNCVDGEVFGDATLLFKEENLRNNRTSKRKKTSISTSLSPSLSLLYYKVRPQELLIFFFLLPFF